MRKTNNKTAATDWAVIQRDATTRAHQQEIKDRDVQIERYSSALQEVSAKLDIALAVQAVKAKPVKIEPVAPGESEATAVAVASDWHVEEPVRKEDVNGLNEFNLDIARRRIAKFFSTVVRLVEIERAGTRIDDLLLILGGDFLSGHIHEELAETSQLSPTQTLLWLRDEILGGLKFLDEKGGFKRIKIVCAYGNHARTTKKPRHATAAANSYERLLYGFLAKEAPQYEWVIAESYHTYVQVYDKTLRIHHGDAIQYQGGIGGLAIPLEKAISGWNKARVADIDIHGHHHTQQQTRTAVSNGSLIGYNAYSVAIKAPFEPPQQTLFLLDSKRGRTCTWPIILG